MKAKTDEEYKQLAQMLNALRDHYPQRHFLKEEIVKALSNVGFPKDSNFLPLMVKHGCVIKEGNTKNAYWKFPATPILWVKVKQVFLERRLLKKKSKVNSNPLTEEKAIDLLKNKGFIIEDGETPNLTEQNAITFLKLMGKTIKRKVITYEVV